MSGRRLHDERGFKWTSPYGKPDQFLMSVERRRLNEELLTAAEKLPDVNVHFEKKLVSCHFDSGQLAFLDVNSNEKVDVEADLIIGTDGAFSTIRRELMKRIRFDFNQEYIPHGYMEFCIPPKEGEFAMEVNFLHIWPRNTFMMIALPNLDKTFTVTLFMPFTNFEAIKTEEQLMGFFATTFPDAIPLIGEKAIKETYFKSGGVGLPMVSVKSSPHHYKDKSVIMGDAAHALVPFYGQGMNCGFEDCLVLDECLDECHDNLEAALALYSKRRCPDAHAICDLAMYNYIEMRESVNSKIYYLRKKFDSLMNKLIPNSWIPLYTMVTFTRLRYSECIKRKKYQDKLINGMVVSTGLGTLVGGGYFTYRLLKAGVLPSNVWETFASFGQKMGKLF
ncbi:kynurenine 3-monooxygenase-like isoform X2 [Lineus longissimus]